MSKTVFFLTKLADEKERERYEDWVRETDIPAARALPGVKSYRVIRIEGPVMEGVPAPSYDYLEIIEVESVEAYQQALKDVDPQLLEQFTSFIGTFEIGHGSELA